MLLDSNATLLPFAAGLPLETELARLVEGGRIMIPSVVLVELDVLVAREIPYARAARRWVNRFPVLPCEGRGDDAILCAARTPGCWVVTADRELRERLNAAGIPVLAPRDRTRLERFLPRAPRAERPGR